METPNPRPLSDIRELSEPSLIDAAFRLYHQPSSTPCPSSDHAAPSQHAVFARDQIPPSMERAIPSSSSRHLPRPSRADDNGSPSSYSTTPPEHPSFYTIPNASVPHRSSSNGRHHPPHAHPRKPSLREAASSSAPKLDAATVPNHGPSRSPIKDVRGHSDAVTSDVVRKLPSRTYLRTSHPADLLEYPAFRHPRVRLELQLSAPLFVGGGSVEGQVKITVDDNERIRSRRSMEVSAVSVDLLGFEHMPSGRKEVFLSIGTELIDADHPPPANMVELAQPLTDTPSWTLIPSVSSLPFMVSLPLDTGPPPFESKMANIRFLLCVTALVHDGGKHYRVRTSQDVCVLSTYDPEKALTSLPSPLTATDELPLPRSSRCETIRLTAGLHRQVWVSGGSIFVDVHISNQSHRSARKLDLILERDVLCYKHAPARTRDRSASQARIFESKEQTVVTRSSVKAGTTPGWNGVGPYESDARTWKLELPRGHATVRCGKFFEVRFFLNVAVALSASKLVSVQLPVILIHMNSLDILPNSVAQVAAAMEERRRARPYGRQARQRVRAASSPSSSPRHLARSRSRSATHPAASSSPVAARDRPPYRQGRAFVAPMQQSLARDQALRDDMRDLRHALDSSPRKHGRSFLHHHHHHHHHGATAAKLSGPHSQDPLRSGATGASSRSAGENTPFRTPPRPPRPPHSVSYDDLPPAAPQLDAPRRPAPPLPPRSHSTHSMRTVPAPFAPRPRPHFTVITNRLAPHALGLTTAAPVPPALPAPPAPPAPPRLRVDGGDGGGDDDDDHADDNDGSHAAAAPAPSDFRDKMDRSRFEFAGVRRKGTSGSLRERGRSWWEVVRRRDGGEGGWI